MTSKEKAEELIVNYKMQIIKLNYDEAKQCALIAVDEILKMIDKSMQGFLDSDIIAYWQQVKKEIEKL